MATGSLTTTAESKMLLHSVGKEAWTMPSSTWLGLFFALPTENELLPGSDTEGTEVAGNGYARIKISDSATNRSIFGTATVSGALQNNGTSNASPSGLSTGGTGVVTFAAATEDWINGPVVGVGIFTAETGGDLIWYAPLPSAKTVLTGDVFEFPSNAIQLFLT